MIACVDSSRGIGFENTIPWHVPEDMKHFVDTTSNHICVMGRNTYLSIKDRYFPLCNRISVVVTASENMDAFYASNEFVKTDIEKGAALFVSPQKLNDMLTLLKAAHPSMKIFIIGGEMLYSSFIDYEHLNKIHITQLAFAKNQTPSTTCKFPKIPATFEIQSCTPFQKSSRGDISYTFIDYVRKTKTATDIDTDREYFRVAKKILTDGQFRDERTGTGTAAIFGEQMRFNIKDSIPILTTKRVPWKSCIEELLWFLQGDTDSKHLSEKGVHIWDGNSSRDFLDKNNLVHLEEGDCGANYSFQWRHFGKKYSDKNEDYSSSDKSLGKHSRGVEVGDQIAYVIDLLQNDPYSRRIFMSAWNPVDIFNTCLPPCHVSTQFFVSDDATGSIDGTGRKMLSCHMYQRSCDFFLGVPWNILSYAILTYILAKKCNMEPCELVISTGDTHVYKNHIMQINHQMERDSLAAPKLLLSDDIIKKDFKNISIDDFQMIGYFPHPSIRGEMAV